jgi:hypothetical protein
MIPVSAIGRSAVPGGAGPGTAAFWFIMSMALLTGFIIAYPMNWWLVSRSLKHGMLTVRGQAAPDSDNMGASTGSTSTKMAMDMDMKMDMKTGVESDAHQMAGGQEEHRSAKVAPAILAAMTALSFAVMAAGILVAVAVGAL